MWGRTDPMSRAGECSFSSCVFRFGDGVGERLGVKQTCPLKNGRAEPLLPAGITMGQDVADMIFLMFLANVRTRVLAFSIDEGTCAK